MKYYTQKELESLLQRLIDAGLGDEPMLNVMTLEELETLLDTRGC